MSNSQSVQEIFKSEQHFWCHEGNKHIADWVTINAQDHPNLYATFLNDSNAVMYKSAWERRPSTTSACLPSSNVTP